MKITSFIAGQIAPAITPENTANFAPGAFVFSAETIIQITFLSLHWKDKIPGEMFLSHS